jgi:cytochrome c nitrite reductase small subunit
VQATFARSFDVQLPEHLGAGLGLIVAVGILVGVGGYTFFYADGASYFSKDPKACANCHVMQPHYDSWIKSSHGRVAGCADCHLPDSGVEQYVAKADNGIRHAWAFTFQNYDQPIRIIPRNSRILQNSCVDCHGRLVHGILESSQSPNCVRCHMDVGHGPRR